MEGYDPEWESLVEGLARDLGPALLRRVLGPHLDRIGDLNAPSEKLVYLYLLVTQPQSFTTLRRGLDISRDTLSRTLGCLSGIGVITRDTRFLYWISEPPS